MSPLRSISSRMAPIKPPSMRFTGDTQDDTGGISGFFDDVSSVVGAVTNNLDRFGDILDVIKCVLQPALSSILVCINRRSAGGM